MTKANELISLVPVTMHKASYKGRNRWARNHHQAIAWIAKQIMLDVIYPDRYSVTGEYSDSTERFADWDIVKAHVLSILNTEDIEAAEAYVKNYLENEYLPPSEDNF